MAGNTYGACAATRPTISACSPDPRCCARKSQCQLRHRVAPFVHSTPRSSPKTPIQMAAASMYLSKHHGGNAVSTAVTSSIPYEAKKLKRAVRDVLAGTLSGRVSRAPSGLKRVYPPAAIQTELKSLPLNPIRQPTSAPAQGAPLPQPC